MRPVSETDVSEAIKAAKGRLAIRGGGTRSFLPTEGEVISTAGLCGVELYEPGALTLVVRAGTPLAEVEALLAGERQRLAFEVPDLCGLLGRKGVSSIGGVVAANASGPRRVQAGAARDSLLGVRFVDGLGVIAKNGGRVMKNVTGYDLVKLMAGSRGSLGVLTEVSLRVQAVPEAAITLTAPLGVEAGLAALRAALGSPYDISGATYVDGQAMLRVEGMAGSVAYRATELQRVLGGGWALHEAEVGAPLWAAVRDVTAFAAKPGSVWRLVVKPSEAARIAATLGGEAVFDWGGGLIWLLTAGGQAASVRAAVGRDGHATLVRPGEGDEAADVFAPESPAVAGLTQALRAKFDPRHLFRQS